MCCSQSNILLKWFSNSKLQSVATWRCYTFEFGACGPIIFRIFSDVKRCIFRENGTFNKDKINSVHNGFGRISIAKAISYSETLLNVCPARQTIVLSTAAKHRKLAERSARFVFLGWAGLIYKFNQYIEARIRE